MDVNFRVGTLLQTKKPHPCGGTQWEVVRTGADIGIKCLMCGRLVMLLPDELKKRVRRVVNEEKE